VGGHDQEPFDLLRPEDERHLLWLFDAIDLGSQIVPTQRHLEQELDARHDAVAIADATSAFDKVKLEQSHVVGCRGIRRALQPSRETLATMNMTALRVPIEITRRQVFKHALSQRCGGRNGIHGKLLFIEVEISIFRTGFPISFPANSMVVARQRTSRNATGYGVAT
jgi:hypothetical protein